jgi:segregation and condensation protein B
MTENYIKNVVEAALLAAGRPLQLADLGQLFEEHSRPDPAALRTALDTLEADYSGRGIEVKETATGFRIQVRRDLANEVSRLWPERPPRYSRALLETLALIAYRQPITRAEIEAVRGVAVNPNIIKTVLERNWVRVVGTRDVPGRPELLGTTKEFLDYFGLRALDDLPPLAELKAMGEINLQLDLAKPEDPSGSEGGSEGSGGAAPAGNESDGGSAVAAAGVAAAAVAGAIAVEGATSEGAATAEGNGANVESAATPEVASDAANAELAATSEVPADAANAESAATSEVPADAAVVELAAAPGAEWSAAVSASANEDSVEAVAEAGESAGDGEPVDEGDLTGEVVPGSAEYTAAAPVARPDADADSGDVTVEVETLVMVEARIEASIETSFETDETVPAADTSIETGQFEMAELGMSVPPSVSVIEAEFDVDDLTSSGSDDETADDDEEELSAGPQSSTELVAAPRDRDD